MEPRIYSPEEIKLSHFILDEMQWQYKNWGNTVEDLVEERLQYVEKHLNRAKQAIAAGDETLALSELRVLAGIVFSVLQKHPAPQRPQ
jgi:hypothetical protein